MNNHRRVKGYKQVQPAPTPVSVLTGEGSPTTAPQPDQIPIYYDTEFEKTYLWLGGEWVALDRSFADLSLVDLTKVTNPTDELHLPVTYTIEGFDVEGVVSLGEIRSLVGNYNRVAAPFIDQASHDKEQVYVRAMIDPNTSTVDAHQYNSQTGQRGEALTPLSQQRGLFEGVVAYDPAYPEVIVGSSVAKVSKYARADVVITSAAVVLSGATEGFEITGTVDEGDHSIRAYARQALGDLPLPVTVTGDSFRIVSSGQGAYKDVVIEVSHPHLSVTSDVIVSSLDEPECDLLADYQAQARYNPESNTVEYKGYTPFNIELYYHNQSRNAVGMRIPVIQGNTKDVVYNVLSEFPYNPDYPDVMAVISTELNTCQETTSTSISGAL